MEHNFEANFFTLLALLDAGSRIEIDGACKEITVPAQTVIYEQGALATSVGIVVSGRVEVLTQSPDGKKTRSIGFMGKGEFFGDLGVLTGHERLGSVVACEETTILQIEKMAFIQLLEKIPKMGAYFARNLARRLHRTSTEAHLNVYSLDLTGNLQHFDLLTIFQAITSTGRSGELHLHNSANELIGSFFFSKGRAERARFVHLCGIEAIWQGFMQSVTDGTFNFQVRDKPTEQFTDDTKLQMESTDLMLQGVSQRDLFQALPESLREMKGRIGRKTETLTWTDPETQVIAERIWELIAKRPQSLSTLWKRLPYASNRFLEAVNGLLISGQVEELPDTPTGPLPKPV